MAIITCSLFQELPAVRKLLEQDTELKRIADKKYALTRTGTMQPAQQVLLYRQNEVFNGGNQYCQQKTGRICGTAA